MILAMLVITIAVMMLVIIVVKAMVAAMDVNMILVTSVTLVMNFCPPMVGPIPA